MSEKEVKMDLQSWIKEDRIGNLLYEMKLKGSFNGSKKRNVVLYGLGESIQKAEDIPWMTY